MTIKTEDLIRYKDELIGISYAAGKAILEIYNSEDFDIEVKGDDSPLTRADLAANKIICDGLRKITPSINIISEENAAIPYDERSSWEYCWIVDPLDGTKEFIKRNGEFTTNIALVHHGTPILGVVYVPALDQMYYGIAGVGAYAYQESESDTKLKATPFSSEDKGLKIVCSRSHLNDATQAFVDQYESPELVASGSSLKFILIAKGEAHLYPRLAPTSEWDTAAAHCILLESGGQINVAGTTSPLVYNKEDILNPYFIASAPLIA